MPVQRPPRPLLVLASVLAAAGLVLAAASCAGHITPLGPDQAATMPQPHHLRSPLIVQDMRTQGLVPPPGGCPAGWVTLSGGPGQPRQCYRGAARPARSPPQRSPGLLIPAARPRDSRHHPSVQFSSPCPLPTSCAGAVLPTAPGPGPSTASAVTSATPIPAISVAGRTWILLGYATPSAGGEFDVTLPSRNQALQLQRMLVPSG
jgi:hypothetical protein